MTQLFLTTMSIGPVQDFIAAARRTSDLFAGSHLLTQITGAAANAFPDWSEETGAGRIFPLDPTAGGANRILAIVENPREIVQEAKKRATQTLMDAWAVGLNRLDDTQKAAIDVDRAKRQIENFLEIYSAWVPYDGQNYAQRRTEVERLLAGRKALRDFSPTAADDAGIFNSPLDPSRTSVVTKKHQYSVADPLQKGPLFLRSVETLDAISLLKRLHRNDYLTSLTQPRGKETLLDHVLTTRELSQRSRQSDFTDPDPDEQTTSDDFVPDFQYYCVLVADGDHMGAMLSNKENNNTDKHREISGQLDEFSIQADEIVRKNYGQPVYAGGDDVMALLPVVQAVKCAHALAQSFSKIIGGTLSVGLAVCHYKEPLSQALRHAHECESDAKQDRDSLTLGIYHRSGEPLQIRQSWAQYGSSTGLHTWTEFARRGHVSRGLPHALRDFVLSWPPEAPLNVLDAEVRRIYEHSEPEIPDETKKSIKEHIPTFADLDPARHDEGLRQARKYVDMLIAARFISGIDISDAELAATDRSDS